MPFHGPTRPDKACRAKHDERRDGVLLDRIAAAARLTVHLNSGKKVAYTGSPKRFTFGEAAVAEG